jgi:hypothetical protein
MRNTVIIFWGIFFKDTRSSFFLKKIHHFFYKKFFAANGRENAKKVGAALYMRHGEVAWAGSAGVRLVQKKTKQMRNILSAAAPSLRFPLKRTCVSFLIVAGTDRDGYGTRFGDLEENWFLLFSN